MALNDLTKVLLSGGTNGRGIAVAATATPGTTIHTAHATDYDELYLWANNIDTVDHLLWMEMGGTSDSDHNPITIPAQSGKILLEPGIPYTGSVVIKAYADAANKVNISGFVNRIAQS